MRRTIAILALAALAACNQSTPDSATPAEEVAAAAATPTVNPAEAGFEAVAPGTYDVVHAGGAIDKLIVHPGLTWSMVAANGDATGGTIFAQGGKNCFVTEGVDGHRCFSGTPPADDGSITVTGDDGEVATVRPSAS
jgi:hypothetical protein